MSLISVIVPVFNAEKYIARCINSILKQTLVDFELILIDDGSIDKSGEICDIFAKKDERIRVIHQTNQGQAATRNSGVLKAKGEWIAFVDADDVIHCQMLEFLYCAVKDHRVKISCCRACEDKIIPTEFSKNCKYVSYIYEADEKNLLSWFLGEEAIDKYLYWVVWGKLIHRCILEKFPLHEGRIYEDNAIVFRWLYEAKQIAFCDNTMYFYFINQDGTTKSSYTLKHLDYLWALKKQYIFFKRINFKFLTKEIGKKYLLAGLLEYQKVNTLLYKKTAIRLKISLLNFIVINRKSLDLSKSQKMDILTRLYPKQMHRLWEIKHRLWHKSV